MVATVTAAAAAAASPASSTPAGGFIFGNHQQRCYYNNTNRWHPSAKHKSTTHAEDFHVFMLNSYNAEICSDKPWKPKGFSQFEITINFLVCSFSVIWIPMLWVYGHYNYFNSVSTGIDFIRQNPTSVDVRFWRMKTIPALKGLKWCRCSTRKVG